MWTTTDIRYLREHASLGTGELAIRLGRSPAAVKRAASRFGVSLRRSESRRVLLGGELRADLVSGRVDQEGVGLAAAANVNVLHRGRF